MSDSTRSLTSLFGRSFGRSKRENAQEPARKSEDVSTGARPSVESGDAISNVDLQLGHTRTDSGHSRGKGSIFRLPRRKKSVSLPRLFTDTNAEDGAASSNSMGMPAKLEPKRSFQLARRKDKRPSLSANGSSTSLTSRPLAESLLAISGALIGSSSPRPLQGHGIEGPIERLRLSRQQSARSIASQTSAVSSPIQHSDRVEFALDSNGTIGRSKSRGRSLTYAGATDERRALSAKPSKFFTLGRLRKGDSDTDVMLRGLSQEALSVPSSPLPPESRTSSPSLILPQPQPEETARQYLERVATLGVPKSGLAAAFATSDGPVHRECLALVMQRFDFTQDPLDMALRKLLMDSQLPKETQQIDRMLTAFATRYHDCNPGLYSAKETPYVLSFALIMLHTDRFNQNNRSKMTKAQFIKNTTSDATAGVGREVLDYFYDNIVCTPFVLVADSEDLSAIVAPELLPDRPNTPAVESTMRPNASTSSINLGKRSPELYPLLLEGKLDVLRPPVGALLEVSSELSYTGTLPVINVLRLQTSFANAAVLQLVSARSRPEAYVDDQKEKNPLDTEPGVVDVKVYKIGILKKKEQKKPDSKGSYREWGVFLTGAQLLLFKNVAWVKHYMNQVREHSSKNGPCRLEPPWSKYAPDTYFPVADAAAVFDLTPSRKMQFHFLGRSGDRTSFVATSEDEMNDWVAKINYAAAFHTVGVQTRQVEDTPFTGSLRRRASRASIATTATMPFLALSEHAIARQQQIRRRIEDLDLKIAEKKEQLSGFDRLGYHLSVLTPVQSRTRSQLISAAGALAARKTWMRFELVKLVAHRDILAKDLELELDASATPFTASARPLTPTSQRSQSLKTSPSKAHKFGGSNMAQVIRHASTDTLRKLNRRVGSHDDLASRRDSSSREGSLTHGRQASELLPNPLRSMEFTSETLDRLFQNSPAVSRSSSIAGARPEDIGPNTAAIGASKLRDSSSTPLTSPGRHPQGVNTSPKLTRAAGAEHSVLSDSPGEKSCTKDECNNEVDQSGTKDSARQE